MTPTEVNVLLTKAALIDVRLKRVDPAELADRSEVWAEVLAAVPLEVAVEAMFDHYRSESSVLLPADILSRVDVEALAVARERAVQERWCLERGTTLEEFLERQDEPGWLESLDAPSSPAQYLGLVGYVCSVCGEPTEDEPCQEHQPRAYAAVEAVES